MTAADFADLQEALLYVFIQPINWFCVFLVAGGILTAIGWIWLSFLQIISSRRRA
jgi:hypothetical protein